jgi:hypothetical protein
MKVTSSSLHRTAGLLAGALLLLPCGYAADSGKDTDALPTFAGENHISFGAQGTLIDGSSTAFQTRSKIARTPAGGIEDLSYSYDLNKDTSLQLNGHALVGANDYLASFKLSKNELGSFEAGYKTFRTFYDGAGGFFPGNNAFIPLFPRAQFVDRGQFFVGATIELPNAPVLSFRYTNETRSGRKDSTIWGDSDYTGIPIYAGKGAVNPVSSNRKILPAYLDLDEQRQTWEASAKHTVANTTGVLTVSGTKIDNFDVRSIRRYSDESRLYPYPSSSGPIVQVPNDRANNPIYGFDQRGYKEDSLTFAGHLETVINDKVTVYLNGSHYHATGDINDARLTPTNIPTNVGIVSAVGGFTPGGRPPYSYTSTGHIKNTVVTGNIGAELRLVPDLNVDVALKGEDYSASGTNNATYVNSQVNTTTGVVTSVPVLGPNGSHVREKVWTPEVNARYSGIRGVTLYGSWDYRSSPGDERVNNTSVTITSTSVTQSVAAADDRVKENHRNLKLGANWVPASFVTFRAEVFTKDHDNNFTGYGDSLGDYYNLQYNIEGAQLSAKVHVVPQLAFTTRYIQQQGKAVIMGNGYLVTRANDSHRYQISETVDWTPVKQFYMQGNVNYVLNSIKTSYDQVTFTAKDVLHNSDNNYWNASVLAGFVVDKDTDAQVQATYYNADNWNPAMAGSTVPYGAGSRDYSVTVGVKRKLTDRMVASAKLGYVNSENETMGGFADYKGLVGFVTVDYKL